MPGCSWDRPITEMLANTYGFAGRTCNPTTPTEERKGRRVYSDEDRCEAGYAVPFRLLDFPRGITL